MALSSILIFEALKNVVAIPFADIPLTLEHIKASISLILGMCALLPQLFDKKDKTKAMSSGRLALLSKRMATKESVDIPFIFGKGTKPEEGVDA